MTRMIERWFPCTEVSENSSSGWGSGNTERNLFTWFAARPTAQAKAAIVCSLLPWPDDIDEQVRLQDLVRRSMQGPAEASDELREAIASANADAVNVLDPFSGRGIIPLEGARLGLRATAVDYSPVAVLASELLTEYPFVDWGREAELPFDAVRSEQLHDERPRLVRDVEVVLAEIGRRYVKDLSKYYPKIDGTRPWAYLWAVSLPCPECGHRYPLFGNNVLQTAYWRAGRGAQEKYYNPGQAFKVVGDRATGEFIVSVHDGEPREPPTLTVVPGAGKAAVCPFCRHVMPLAVARRLTDEHLGQDELLLVAEHDDLRGKLFREPTALEEAGVALAAEAPFSPFLPARPNEAIAPGNNNIIGPSIYGARTFGDLCNDRQTLAFVHLCRHHGSVYRDLIAADVTAEYASALCSYSASAIVRKIMRSTRGAKLLTYRDGRPTGINNIWTNETSLTFSYDYVEVGLSTGAGSWAEAAGRTVMALDRLVARGTQGRPATVLRGSATSLPIRDSSVTAVITDPPYDEMIPYADASDIYYVWLRRALVDAKPELALSADPYGAQEKADEIIVKRSRGLGGQSDYVEHRTREHYDTMMARAFSEMRRVVRHDGVVTVVFGHGEPEVWQRLLRSIERAGLVMTGSWPANTESGGMQGKANIRTTLTMSCRPAPADRQPGRKGVVDAEIKAAIKQRYPDWERWGLAPADMLMAAAGPAMEIVGRYSEVRDSRGEPVGIHTFLPLARAAVQDAMAVEVDHRPLESFDARTRFALWWVRLYGRQAQPKSELRWQVLASSLELDAVRDLVAGDKTVSFVTVAQSESEIDQGSAAIDVALALAQVSSQGLEAMGDVLAASQFAPDDQFLWATVQFLADRLPDSDPDSVAFHRVLRVRGGVGAAAEGKLEATRAAQSRQAMEDRQMKLL
jgi:putative DNA methylase